MACCDSDTCSSSRPLNSPRWRRALWIALAINAGFFLIEIVAGMVAGSVSLQADALDFMGDAANYAVSLGVAGMALVWRARASLVKGATMAVLGLWVFGSATYNALAGTVPDAPVMGVVAAFALAANFTVALMLYRFRDGDSNMRSVWICSRNDAIGNVAVMLAALGVFGTGAGWPDLAIATIMALLALSGACQIIRHALAELRDSAASSLAPAE
jgi:cation diffusion facilitator family transporter